MLWLFISGFILGVYFVFYSSSWFGAWVGLELNLMCLIPILLKQGATKVEAGLKYFLAQACGSVVFIASGVGLGVSGELSAGLLSISLLLKLGATPFHSWFISVLEVASWGQNLLLSTLQKFSPLILISYSCSVFMGVMAAILSGAGGALGGLSEYSLRKMLGCSSVNHLGWVLLAASCEKSVCFIYMILYSFILFSVIFPFFKNQVYHLYQTISISAASKWSLLVGLLSLGGMPPLLGFFPKCLLLSEVFDKSGAIVCWVMILFNVVTLYYYMRLGVKLFLILKSFWMKKAKSNSFILSSFVNMSGGGVSSVVWVSFLH